MKTLCQIGLFMLLPWSVWAAEPCKITAISDEATAIKALDDLTPEAPDADSKACIATALDLLSELRSKKAIPELIRYLPFKREITPEEKEGFISTYRSKDTTNRPYLLSPQ